MHAVVMESLEEYLVGSLEPSALRAVETHLSTCQMCREEVHGMEDLSNLFGSLRPEQTASLDISPGFYAQVMQQVEAGRPRSAFANLFSIDMAFGRRLVFASLLTLAVLGGYLVTHEERYATDSSPEAILAQQDAPSFEARPVDNMLLTLTAYEH